MRNRFATWGLIVTIILGWSGVVDAQNQPAGREGPGTTAAVPLKVQLTISRYQGEKRISSVPYTLSVIATDNAARPDEPSRLRMGVQVPLPAPPLSGQDAKPGTGQAGTSGYRDVGTNIDCVAKTIGDGRYKVSVTIEESSLYDDSSPAPGARVTTPVFRQFRVNSVLILADGQSEQFSTATDRISGEIVKMDVTLSVLK